MKHIIIGTAGHVDHGKTCLTEALTGKNPDRLKEEKERGITIEIGFAQLTLPNGQKASIIDVPGHEKLIQNMLVGASGMDVVLMVVAADEGFMPQTQEHLDILSLLGMTNGIIVVTKVDMVEQEWLEVVMEDIRERVAGTFLENAPMVAVSSKTGEGIDALKDLIVNLVNSAQEKNVDRAFRLPVDRVFSIKGFGTVVTGTITEGTTGIGKEVMLFPSRKTGRIRELQNHDVHIDNAAAGMRTAINITGIDCSELGHGFTVAEPDSVLLSRQIDVFLKVVGDSPFAIKNNSQHHFYTGTQESVCHVKLLDADVLKAGQSGFAQLRFEEPLAARNGDRFILRFFSPMITIGGGVIADVCAGRHARNSRAALDRLGNLTSGRKEQQLLQRICDSGSVPIGKEKLSLLCNLSARETNQALHQLQQEVVQLGNGYVSKEKLDVLWNKVQAILTEFHANNPLLPGMHLGELRSRVLGGGDEAALKEFVRRGDLRIENGAVAMASFAPEFSPEQESVQQEIEIIYLAAGFLAPENSVVEEHFADRLKLYKMVSTRMRKDGVLIALTQQNAVHKDAYKEALCLFRSLFTDRKQVTLADFRTAANISRKYAQMFLDYFDGNGISKRVGDARVLK